MSNKITSARALRCRHWYQKSVAELDDSLREVLAVLDRLVEAANKVIIEMDAWDAAVRTIVDCSKVPKWAAIEELRNALRDIELESE